MGHRDVENRQAQGLGVAMFMLWVQAMTEEIGWRGFLLPGLMRALGPWRGLFAHGAATLTISAALPLVLNGATPPRTGIYLPVGWVPLVVAIVAILCTRHRLAIRSFGERP